MRFKESSKPDLPERDFLADHDPYELLGRFQVAFFFVVVSPLYPFAASEVMLEEVLRWLTAFSWVGESICLAADVCLKLGFQRFTQLRSRAEPSLVMSVVRVIGGFHD